MPWAQYLDCRWAQQLALPSVSRWVPLSEKWSDWLLDVPSVREMALHLVRVSVMWLALL